MFNKTFKTLDKYPKIYLGFAVSSVITTFFVFLGGFLADKYLISFINIGLIGDNFYGRIFSMLFGSIGSIIVYIFLFPLLFLYVKRACLDVSADEGFTFFYKDKIMDDLSKITADYKSILKENWYKIILVYLLTFCALIILSIPFILSALLSYLLVGYIGFIYVFIIGVISLLAQIASVCVILEDSFKEGIKCTFKYGKAIIFPLFGASVVIGIPLLIIMLMENSVFENTINSYSFLTNEFASYILGSQILIVILIVFQFAYGIYRNSFVYTYLTQMYYQEKYEKQSVDDLSIKFEGDVNDDITFDDYSLLEKD